MQGRGTVVTGRVEQGTIKTGEDVEILGLMQVRVVSLKIRELAELIIVVNICKILSFLYVNYFLNGRI